MVRDPVDEAAGTCPGLILPSSRAFKLDRRANMFFENTYKFTISEKKIRYCIGFNLLNLIENEMITFPELWRTVVRFLHCLSRLMISFVASKSKSNIPLNSEEELPASPDPRPRPKSSLSLLMVFRLVASRLALRVAIFSMVIASDSDLGWRKRIQLEPKFDNTCHKWLLFTGSSQCWSCCLDGGLPVELPTALSLFAFVDLPGVVSCLEAPH